VKDLAEPGTAAGKTEEDGLPEPRRTLAMLCLLAAIAAAVIDGSIVNVALPTIARSLDVAPDQAIWIVTAYQTALVAFLLTFAALGEIFGFRRIFTAGLVLFVVASLVCATARSLTVLLVARAAIGLSGAAMFGVSTALMRLIQPRARLGRTIGTIALLVATSMAIAPTIGAAIIAVADWWWIFPVNIPFGVLALALAGSLPEPKPHSRPFDGISAALTALVFGLLISGLSVIARTPAWGLAAVAAAVVAGAILLSREFKQAVPLVPLDLFRIRPFTVAVSASTCCFAAQTCAFVGLPFFLQDTLALGEVETGLILTAWPAAVAVTAPIAGRMADHLPASVICGAGSAAMAVGLGLLGIFPPGTPSLVLAFATVLAGLGFGWFQTPNNRAMLLSAPLPRSGAAGGVQATARQFGQATGAALVALAFTLTHHDAQTALLMGAGFALVAAALSFQRGA
jgi:DHA2 family multidrug resistance protein-like MFS transporter